MANEDVRRAAGMCHRSLHAAVEVEQFDGHIDRVAGEGNEEDVLERPPHVLGLARSQPFLEKGGEGVAVYDLLRAVRPYRNLPVAGQRQLGKPCATPEPSGQLRKLVDIKFLPACIARKDIVEPQGLVVEPFLKCLCSDRQSTTQHQEGSRQPLCSLCFHICLWTAFLPLVTRMP